MESFTIQNLNFTYPNCQNKALHNINLCVNAGEFVTLCGKSGCGKTTLLRLLKSSLAPNGEIDGEIYFCGKLLCETDDLTQAARIGFVAQNPDSQIVTDKVWHELAFGLESLGLSTPEIRARVSEMASFFGIQNWFYKSVAELSGGQKQLLNLASVMAMQPSVLILDEPTSQLDPIAAEGFLKTVAKINRELGTTVILSEHRLEDAIPLSDTVVVMEDGKIIACDKPQKVLERLKADQNEMCEAFPVPMQVYGAVADGADYPLTVRDGRVWLEHYAQGNPLNESAIPQAEKQEPKKTVIEIKDAWFRYQKSAPDVIKGLNAEIKEGELFALVGGNGSGKTTALSLMSGLNTPYRGKVLINGKEPSQISNLYGATLGVLPQNPQSLFVKKTVLLDLKEILTEQKMSHQEAELRLKSMAELCQIEGLLQRHPYDLSGGEQQRVALAKVLLLSPRILLLDEPTKGMDTQFKGVFAEILQSLTDSGVTIVMVSHDIEFCARYAHRCALVFDGGITSCGAPREFFAGKCFYTTASNRMARSVLPNAILAQDIIAACGKSVPTTKRVQTPKAQLGKSELAAKDPKPKAKKPSTTKVVAGGLLLLLGVVICVLQVAKPKGFNLSDIFGASAVYVASLVLIGAGLWILLPKREYEIGTVQQPKSAKALGKQALASVLVIAVIIPLTIYAGVHFLHDRKYYFISLVIMLEAMAVVGMRFEGKKPKPRELIVISVMCAIAVAGRTAFYTLPQFKPVLAVVIICGVCLGGETGFLVGAVTAFVSNFFFGQGPWTPWQMFAFGAVGFVAGVLFQKGLLRKTKLSLCIFGAFATVIIYGGIMNPASVVMSQAEINPSIIWATYATGLPFDLIHAFSTVFFLWFGAEPVMEKLERVKQKYGVWR